MSGEHAPLSEPTAIVIDRDQLRRSERWAWMLGGGGAVICALLACFWPAAVARAWLPAFLFSWGLSIGCLSFLLLFALVGGGWGQAALPFLKAGARLIPLTAVFALPLAFALPALYEWTDPAIFAGHSNAGHRPIYFKPSFFLLRSAAYFLLWCLLSWPAFLKSTGLRRTSRPSWFQLTASKAGGGLVLMLLSITWAGMDWVMSLNPWFASSLFGALIGMGALMTAMATVAVATGMALMPTAALPSPGRDPAAGRPQRLGISVDARFSKVRKDVKNLLLAFVMLWIYLSFAHYLIIWSGDLPEEAEWYADRLNGGWQWVGFLVVLGGMVIPFCVLLSRKTAERRNALISIGLWILAVHYLALCWQTLPAFSPGRFRWHPAAFLTIIATGGVWAACFLRTLGRQEYRFASETDREVPNA